MTLSIEQVGQADPVVDDAPALYLPENTDTGVIDVIADAAALPDAVAYPAHVTRTLPYARPGDRIPVPAGRHVALRTDPVLPTTRRTYLSWPERVAVAACFTIAAACVAALAWVVLA